MASYHETLPPGYTAGTASTPREILASLQFDQVGIICAGGQGVLLAGTVMGQKTSDEKWYIYDNAASDGTEVARGFLRRNTDTGTGSTSQDTSNELVVKGQIKNSMTSRVDSNALTDLNARQDTVLDIIDF